MEDWLRYQISSLVKNHQNKMTVSVFLSFVENIDGEYSLSFGISKFQQHTSLHQREIVRLNFYV